MNQEKQYCSKLKVLRAMLATVVMCLLYAGAAVVCIPTLQAQQKPAWTPQQEAIIKQVRGLRQLPDQERGSVTKQLAIEIR